MSALNILLLVSALAFAGIAFLAVSEMHKRGEQAAQLTDEAEERVVYWRNQWEIRGDLMIGTEEALQLAYEANAKKTKRLTDLAVRDGHRVVRGCILPDLMRPEPGRSVGPTPIFDAIRAEVA